MIGKNSIALLCLIIMLLCCTDARAGYVPQGEGKMSTNGKV